jgi:CO dehydrogenase/acetyl-CoA synthase alpha subunit
MEETGKARTEIGMYAEVADYLTEQVPAQVMALTELFGR